MAKQTKNSKSTAPKELAARYGIFEWYGTDIRNIDPQSRIRLAEKSLSDHTEECPFMQRSFPGILCRKKGGVCSIVPYAETDDGTQMSGTASTVCPDRFWENEDILADIALRMLNSTDFYVVREVNFLKTVGKARSARQVSKSAVQGEIPELDVDGEEIDEGGKAVGKIDLLIIDANNDQKWCAVELQSVYFSGLNMETHRRQFRLHGQSLPRPDANRRPDYRSSSSKRLLPQLQIKVPEIGRWAKMVVVVDKAFFDSLAPMETRKDKSMADIVWNVVDYDELGHLYTRDVVMTTLAQAIIGLTAAVPVSEAEFYEGVKRNIRDFEAVQKAMPLFGNGLKKSAELIKKAKTIRISR